MHTLADKIIVMKASTSAGLPTKSTTAVIQVSGNEETQQATSTRLVGQLIRKMIAGAGHKITI